jgi:formamidopyrimidine-DNA glycosylase
MPEMPELEVLRDYFEPRLSNREISRVSVSPKFGFLLRTPLADLARALEGQAIGPLSRRGKFFTIEVADRKLVINPMLGGRLHWSPVSAKPPPSWLFALEIEGSDVLHLTDFARMARVYLVSDAELETVPGWSEMGPEAADVSAGDFATRIKRHPGELKNLLRNQAFVAGIGNAYSDEILHAAQMLPLRKRPTLKPDDLSLLHASVGKVLNDAVTAIKAQPGYEPHKQDRSFMAVHMKGGEACPRCGHRIAQLSAGGSVTNFCRGCQR